MSFLKMIICLLSVHLATGWVRTGEHFMEFSVPGFIKRFCTPNAILTLSEYICDYAQGETVEKDGRQ